MIFDILKRKWLHEEYLKYDARKQGRHLQWPQSLVIIVDTAYYQDASVYNNWLEQLHIAKEKITIIGLCKSVKKSLIQDMNLVDKGFLKIFGGVTDDNVATLLDRAVDLQINFFNKENLLLHYLARRTNAAFRVGFAHHSEETFDLGLEITANDTDILINEVVKYLKIITK